MSSAETRPIIFLGPTMTLEEARGILPEADYRPPAARGDIDAVPDGGVVGLIDGRFEQVNSVSPRELQNALLRGVAIMGSSSMGALRAAEVPGMYGVGRIYEMYRDGIVERDDEVALVFDEERFHALSVPLVNVRYAVDSLIRPGTLTPAVGKRILAAARKLHYSDRTYPRILREAGLHEKADAGGLLDVLSSYDLKKNDAHLLLEQMPRFAERQRQTEERPTAEPVWEYRDHFEKIRPAGKLPADAPVLIWEYGDPIAFEALVTFLKVTGEFASHARQAVARFLFHGNSLNVESLPAEDERAPSSDDLFARVFDNWGWRTSEELKVTLRDLGVGFLDLKEILAEEVSAERVLEALAQKPTVAFYKALRAQLLLDGLSLKRAAFRLGSITYFAAEARAAKIKITEADRRAARSVLLWINRVPTVAEFERHLLRQGVDRQAFARFVDQIALARAAAANLVPLLAARPHSKIRPVKLSAALKASLGLTRSPKAPGSRRFCVPLPQGGRYAKHIAKRIGVTRVGMIGELTTLGIHVSTATRPHTKNVWSTTVGSGKGTTRAGAVIGGVLEECEKFAQEKFDYQPVMGSYAKLRSSSAIDPTTLDLPYDSMFEPDLEIAWASVFDLMTGRRVLVPAAPIDARRTPNDIYYSVRAGRKIHSTNGLASGFTPAEALLHALCEYVERHAAYLSELHCSNPGRLGQESEFKFIDLATLPKCTARRLVAKFERAGYAVHLLDQTCEVQVPCFSAYLIDDRAQLVGGGYGCHPDPVVAAEMALLEAGQGLAGNAAGNREDLTLKARSLGRHERPRPLGDESDSFVVSDRHPFKPFGEILGFTANNVLAEVEWVLGCLSAAGIEHALAVDLTTPEIRPASVFRVVIPGLETNNPFRAGPRSRAHGIAYLLDWPRLTR